MSKKIILLFIILIICFSVFSVAQAMTESEKQALISRLMAQIVQLQAQLNILISSTAGNSSAPSSVQPNDRGTWCHTFNISMKYGDTGIEVSALQEALAFEGFFSLSSSEKTRSYFGNNTLSAVIKFQEKYISEILAPSGLTRATGRVSIRTRTKLNQLYGCVIQTQPTTTQQNTQIQNNANQDTNNIICNSNWDCTSWSDCADGDVKSRTCADLNSCAIPTNKPAEISSCAGGNTCADSDSGKNYFLKGSVQIKTIGAENWFTDHCNPNDASSLFEYFCDGANSNYEIKTCENGCINGACRSTACIPNWITYSWEGCINGVQKRVVEDTAKCNILTDKPDETRRCDVPCVPIWQEQPWSNCINGQQSRTVIDINQCVNPDLSGKPITSRSCKSIISGPQDVILNGSGTWILSIDENPFSDQQISLPITLVVNWGDATLNSEVVFSSYGSQAISHSYISYGDKNIKVYRKGNLINPIHNIGVRIHNLENYCTNNSSIQCADIKANSLNGPLRIISGNSIIMSWNSKLVSSCERWLIMPDGIKRHIDYSQAGDFSVTLNNVNDSEEKYEYGITCSLGRPEDGKISDSVVIYVSSCAPEWKLPTAWSECVNNKQTKEYFDANNCGVTTNKPANQERSCGVVTQCQINTQCKDLFQSCYYVCESNQCVPINSFVSLGDYPQCQ